jgi:polyphosphate kinase
MGAQKKHFVSREISWLSFNSRVLQEAADQNNPLMERLRFLGIFSNNLDEFFKIRVATVKRMMRYNKRNPGDEESNPKKIFKEISQIVNDQQKKFDEIYEEITDELEKHKIYFINEQELNPEQAIFVKDFFNNVLRQHLFPIMLGNLDEPDTLSDLTPFLAIHLQKSDKSLKDNYALIEIPSAVSRFLILPEFNKCKYVILIDDVIRYCLQDIFYIFDYDVFNAYTIKFTRDAEIDIDNDVSKSLMELISESLKQRKVGAPIRFIYDETMPSNMLQTLRRKFVIQKGETLIAGSRYHNFKDFIKFPNLGLKKLENPVFPAIVHKNIHRNRSILDALKKQDIMLHYPYHSFQYVVDLLREASIDPNVHSIKMTIYRLAKNSNVVSALINAARNGKIVTVVMEIQARFDERANIKWAEKLQEEGVRIVQSRTGFKIHSKLILISRREGKKDVLYANVGTGNFNEDTAKIYTDKALLTCHPKITSEVEKIFELIELSYKNFVFNTLILSPYNMRDFFMKLLDNEIKNARKGKDAWAIIKLNNLVDDKMAVKLYQASRAGVKIKIICRSSCVIIPGIKGVSDNIEAISIVDKYLEHSRVFVFANGGNEKYYISSADWMVRNFDYRIEVTCPIFDKNIQRELRQMLELQLKDNTKARIISSGNENEYKRNHVAGKVRSQVEIYNFLKTNHTT